MAFTYADPTIQLNLDGIPTTYLLATPDTGSGVVRPPPYGLVYDLRVHTAYVLAQQGHRAAWLATHLDLPRDAARRIVAPARPGAAPAHRQGPRHHLLTPTTHTPYGGDNMTHVHTANTPRPPGGTAQDHRPDFRDALAAPAAERRYRRTRPELRTPAPACATEQPKAPFHSVG
ncbi:hypothetical protein ACFXOD_35015 [Streptomyces sp. NPDC059161]|uniref:hypothetical protein n=1 Tax=Streptomyces sp. NPDC059161 TaxID=3346749 RepID=UPI00368F1C6C